MWENADTLQPFIRRLGTHEARPALLALHAAGIDTWDYRRLSAQVARMANGLREAGIGKGRTVAIFAEPGPEWIVTCLGIIAAGGVVVPLDTQLADDTLQQVLVDSEATLIFSSRSKRASLEQLNLESSPRVVLLDAGAEEEFSVVRLLSENDDLPAVDSAPDDTAALFYTSGTTGPPKGVPLSHRNLAWQLNVIERAALIQPDDRVLVPLPPHHVYPLVVGILAPLGFGLPLVLPQSLTGPQIVRALREAEVTLIIGVPRLYRALYEGIENRLRSGGRVALGLFRGALGAASALNRYAHLPAGRLLFRPLHRQFGPRLRLLASGGAPLDPELGRKLEALGWHVAVGYGLTETAPLLTILRPGEGPLESSGQPVYGIDLRIDHEAVSDELRQQGAGEVLVRGPNVFSGYRHLPEKTGKAFTDGWFRTGDLGRLDRHGNLYLMGRASTLIVTEGGKNIQPEDVEAAYQEHPAIAEAGILQRENRLVGLLVPDMKTVRTSGDDMATLLRNAVSEVSRRLPSYQRLSDFAITREALSRTQLGKLRRHVLETRYDAAKQQGGIAEPAAAGPQPIESMGEADRQLLEHPTARQVWEGLAKRYPDRALSPDTDLQLDLGLDSMDWLNLTMEIGERTGIELSDESIAEVESIRDLLQAVVAAGEGETQPIPATSVLEHPERVLAERERHWLKPLRFGHRLLFNVLYGINRALISALYRPRVEGREHLAADRQYIIAPNHISYVDPFVLGAALDRQQMHKTYWAGWTGAAFRNRTLRTGSRIAQVIPVDPDRGIKTTLALAAEVLRSGHNLVWFPEGTRSPTGELRRLRPGIGVLLETQNVPIVPVAIRGTYESLPKGKALPRPRKVKIVFGEPIDPDQLAREGQGAAPRERMVDGLHKRLKRLLEQADHQ